MSFLISNACLPIFKLFFRLKLFIQFLVSIICIFSDKIPHFCIQFLEFAVGCRIGIHGFYDFFDIQFAQRIGFIAKRVFPILNDLSTNETGFCYLFHCVLYMLFDTGLGEISRCCFCKILFL